MLASAGISMSPHRKFYSKSSSFKYVAFALTAIAAISAFINLRATLPLRTGRLAAMRGDAQTALKYYNESIKIKMSKEALYGKAEIFLHAYGDINNALKSLEDMHNHLGFYNYLHTNRIKTVCLVNANSASAALEFIKLELQAYPLSIINHKLHLDLLKLLKCPQEEISAAEKGFFTACHLRKLSPEQGAKLTMAEDDKYSAN